MNLIKFFTFGILAALGALVAELLLSSLLSILFQIDVALNYADQITFFLLFVVFIEEFFKLLLLIQLPIFFQKKSSSLLSAFFLGGGFGFLEIFSKWIHIVDYSFFSIASLYLFGALLIHIGTAGIIQSIIDRHRNKFSFILAIGTASLFHFFYNLLVIYNQSFFLVSFYFILVFFSIYVFKKNSIYF